MKKSKQARILEHLMSGRVLSQLDCREFGVEDMRTPISHSRHIWEQDYELTWQWCKTITGSRIKLYKLVPKVQPQTDAEYGSN